MELKLRVRTTTWEAADIVSYELRALDGSALPAFSAVLTKEEHAASRSMMICCSGSKSERLVLDL